MDGIDTTQTPFIGEETGGADEGRTLIHTETSLKIVYVVIGSLGLVGNIFVVVVILQFTGMRKQLTNTYIINQSLVDATVAMFLVLTSVLEDDGRYFDSGLDQAFCRGWLTKLWLWGFLVSSTYNLLALTFERYLAIVHPIWHKMNFNQTKVVISIVIVWMFGPAYNMVYMVPTSGITEYGGCTTYTFWPNGTTQRAVGVLTIIIQYFIPLIILSFFYTRMALVLRRRTPADDSNKQGVKKAPDSMARARRNIIKTLALVACSFLVCWTCNQIYFLLFNLGYPLIDFASPFYHFTVVMVFCNCCFNPFIYIAKYEQFQKAMRKMFCRGGNRVSDITGTTATVTAASSE